jgi:protein SCO1
MRHLLENTHRRRFISALSAASAAALYVLPPAAQAHDVGPATPPLAAPSIVLTDHLNQTQHLAAWLSGQVTAVQTMFTGCSTVCPIQGALFAEVQSRLNTLNTKRAIKLLSVSIDPLGDSPDALKRWLTQLQAGANWMAAVPRMADLQTLQRGLDGEATRNSTTRPSSGLEGHHGAKVYFFDAQAQLRWRSTMLPTATDILQVLEHLAKA